ncbi:MAG: hypothetical protein ACXABY_27635 [Candidatus Thorarchaeota archaeon]
MSQKDDAREVAYLVAKGLTPDVVAQKTDLPRAYVDQLTGTDTFLQVLEDVGGESALRIWNEYQIEQSAQLNLRTKVRERVDTYFQILDDIATDPRVKPEVRKDIIFRLMDQARLKEDAGDAVQTMDLPPSFFTSLAEANAELDKQDES